MTTSTTTVVRRLSHPAQVSPTQADREWLVTNGLGGYSSGTLTGLVTRRYHGLLVSALPAPVGRMVLLSHLEARLQPGNVLLSGDGMSLVEFRLELGLPIWRYEGHGHVVESRVLCPIPRTPCS